MQSFEDALGWADPGAWRVVPKIQAAGPFLEQVIKEIPAITYRLHQTSLRQVQGRGAGEGDGGGVEEDNRKKWGQSWGDQVVGCPPA